MMLQFLKLFIFALYKFSMKVCQHFDFHFYTVKVEMFVLHFAQNLFCAKIKTRTYILNCASMQQKSKIANTNQANWLKIGSPWKFHPRKFHPRKWPLLQWYTVTNASFAPTKFHCICIFPLPTHMQSNQIQNVTLPSRGDDQYGDIQMTSLCEVVELVDDERIRRSHFTVKCLKMTLTQFKWIHWSAKTFFPIKKQK